MAKKSIGGIDEQVKASFDAVQEQLCAGSANEALAALLDGYDNNAMLSAFDDIEVAGVSEVKRLLTQTARQMIMVLSHRHDIEVENAEAANKTIEEQKAVIELRETAISERDERIEKQDDELEELRKKSLSVDMLSERIDNMVKTFDRQVDRYEADLAAAKERLGQMTSERDELAEQLKAMTSERDTLTSEVERLTAELAEVKAGMTE